MKKIIVLHILASLIFQSYAMETMKIENKELFIKLFSEKKNYIIKHPTDNEQETYNVQFTPSGTNLTLYSRTKRGAFLYVYDQKNNKLICIVKDHNSIGLHSQLLFSQKNELSPYIASLTFDKDESKRWMAKLHNVINNRVEKEFKTTVTYPCLWTFAGKIKKTCIVNNNPPKSFTVYDIEAQKEKTYDFNFSENFACNFSKDNNYIMQNGEDTSSFLYNVDKDCFKVFEDSRINLELMNNVLMQIKNGKNLIFHDLDNDSIRFELNFNQKIMEYFFTADHNKLVYSLDRKTYYFYDIQNDTTKKYTFDEAMQGLHHKLFEYIILYNSKEYVVFDTSNLSYKKIQRNNNAYFYSLNKEGTFLFFCTSSANIIKIVIYDLKNEKVWDEMSFKREADFSDIVYDLSPDQNYITIATVGMNKNTITVYDIANKKRVFSSDYEWINAFYNKHKFKYHPHGRYVVFAENKNTVCLYDYRKDLLSKITTKDPLIQFDINEDSTTLFVSSKTETLVFKSSEDESSSYCLIL